MAARMGMVSVVALMLAACADRVVVDDAGASASDEDDTAGASATAIAGSSAADTTGASTATTGASTATTGASTATTGATSATTVDPDGGDGQKLDLPGMPPDVGGDPPLECADDPPLETQEGTCEVLVPLRGPRIVQGCLGWKGQDVGCPPPDDPAVFALFYECIDACSELIGEICGPWTNRTDVCCYWSAYEPSEVC